MKRTVAYTPGIILAEALYTAQEARSRLRVGEWAWRQWRRDGLAVFRVSGRAYVSGRAIIEFIERKGGRQV